MTILGRNIIDRIKSNVSHHFKLPVPPYGKPEYWETVYNKIYPDNVYEWANISFEDNMRTYSYRMYNHNDEQKNAEGEEISTTIEETIGVHQNEETNTNSKILMLGCGTSNLGTDIFNHYNQKHPMVQIDISPRLISILQNRHNTASPSSSSEHPPSKNMEYTHDNALDLKTIPKNSIAAIIDKGLMDSFYCDDAQSHMNTIMNTMHRALQPNGIFLFFSYSKPHFILPCIHTHKNDNKNRMLWKEEQIRLVELDFMSSIFMYRFEKISSSLDEDEEEDETLVVVKNEKSRDTRQSRRWQMKQQNS